jgi:transposase
MTRGKAYSDDTKAVVLNMWVKAPDDLKEPAASWIASLTGISPSSVYRILREARESSLDGPNQRGRPRKFTAAALASLRTCPSPSTPCSYSAGQYYEQEPDIYLAKVQERLLDDHNIECTTGTISRQLKRMRVTRKVARHVATERDLVERGLFWEHVEAHYSREQLVWADESAKDDRTGRRRYGRAPSGERAWISSRQAHGKKWSLLPAISDSGLLAYDIMEGAIDSFMFYEFLVEKLVRAGGSPLSPLT